MAMLGEQLRSRAFLFGSPDDGQHLKMGST
jgi:hypothetical protein